MSEHEGTEKPLVLRKLRCSRISLSSGTRLAREVWLATIMVRRPWRGRQTASRQRTPFDLENASEKRHQGEASKVCCASPSRCEHCRHTGWAGTVLVELPSNCISRRELSFRRLHPSASPPRRSIWQSTSRWPAPDKRPTTGAPRCRSGRCRYGFLCPNRRPGQDQ